MEGIPVDVFGRPMGALRISLTDRCNLRCRYCMPEEEYAWLPREHLLTFEEIERLTEAFVSLGVDKVRLTGGEPLLRRGLPELVRRLSGLPGVKDLAMTTNGVLLARHAEQLREAGLHRLTISLDTLRPARFAELTRRGTYPDVLAGIDAATATGLTDLKIDTVVMRGFNDDELADLVEFGRTKSAEVRFIEYMDVGGATGWTPEKVFSRAEILETLTREYGRIEELRKTDVAPADRFLLPDGTVFGIISSTTQPFCATCDRSRLTADGMWLRCLYAMTGTDLREPLRAGASLDELRDLITGVWQQRRDRGAVERVGQRERGKVFVSLETLKRDPHLEMHTRGG
ncbi:cyclic pyranopterin phosphate synthase MoaA [Actinosynnema sp. ALI-1.44]|uniref:GTP 3',8-cyclase MoaA n=1 Tax=Actinosynnema sp. ALI-1.44 TaxID=1933779 RepID=UPI00097C5D59|nr:GTP 3',8-cyclase MoaA [Actinosynnema sp. ALI-1.44]ONI81034.1 cyclic pyranopterin phosphate synthase MoaA [Actinosynnema sp. ALI-1.44]